MMIYLILNQNSYIIIDIFMIFIVYLIEIAKIIKIKFLK